MRVIAGIAKGHRLKAPKGLSTRPMADKIKGALFSMLTNMDVNWGRVLDLYAGTGSLSIEALSRGAEHADLVEMSPNVCRIIAENLEHTKFTANARIYCRRVSDFLHSRVAEQLGKYDIILLDPPYADPAIDLTLQTVGESSLMSENAVVAIGHSPRVDLAEQYGSLRIVRRRCHGDSCFSIFQHVGGS